ncbi:hypothetical protein ACHQM5_018521 [Ranunculus cassubicifolius]
MNSKKYIKKLGKLKTDIIAGQKDVISKLEEAELVPDCRRSNVVTKLLEDVDQFLEATTRIEEEAKKTRPNVRRGSNISRLLTEATELLEKIGGLSEGDLTITTKRGGEEIPVGRIIGETTANKTMERVWDCLMNDKINTVGVHGMGGVGKTTIVKEINNRLLEKHLFDLVIWVTVSQSTNIRQIQDEIVSALNHTLPQTENEVRVSASLFRALKQRKKVVLILDDMWEEVSLEKIGIPEPTQENGCKILLTTRKLEVCRKMGCRENSTIRVELLSENEAWELFMDKVGVELAEDVRKIAKMVVKECACLPLAIITVGGAMRGNTEISEWRNALNGLKYSRKQIVDMETNVFGCLKFSYDRLPDENVKKCFLYCALFPEDWTFIAEELIDYWIMGGLIEGKDSQDEIDQGQSILNKLTNHCLLENFHVHVPQLFEKKNVHVRLKETVPAERVKMHDLIRDMALHVTSLLPYITKAGVFLKELPNEAGWREDLEGASFIKNEIEEILISPRCPKLSILLLNSNRLHSIQEPFFVQLQGLRILDLSQNVDIVLLPDSISDLVNLHGLLLEGCSKLMSLPSLSKLQLLRTLDLRDNRHLRSLPDSISELTNLLVLRLSKCLELKSVPSVAKLLSLRKLELNGSGIKELPQGMEMLVNLTFLNLDETNFGFRETTPSSLENLHSKFLPQETLYAPGSYRGIWEDLLSLKQLESLYISFSSLSVCANYVGSPNYKGLKTFRIAIGFIFEERNNVLMSSTNDIYRSFIAIRPVDVSYDSSFLPQNTQYFLIQEFKDIKSLNDLRCLKDARELRECTVSFCEELEYIKHEEEDECTLLQGLEVLKIDLCLKLHSVYKGNLSSVYCLTKLEIVNCRKLKNVFSSPRMLQHLQSLKVIDIKGCDQMEEIIKAETAEEEGEATNIITLPKLESLTLRLMPNLKNIWRGEMVCDSLEDLTVTECPEMKRIPTRGEKQLRPPLLSSIEGSNEWFDSLEWDHPFAKMLFQPYFRRAIEVCVIFYFISSYFSKLFMHPFTIIILICISSRR